MNRTGCLNYEPGKRDLTFTLIWGSWSIKRAVCPNLERWMQNQSALDFVKWVNEYRKAIWQWSTEINPDLRISRWRSMNKANWVNKCPWRRSRNCLRTGSNGPRTGQGPLRKAHDDESRRPHGFYEDGLWIRQGSLMNIHEGEIRPLWDSKRWPVDKPNALLYGQGWKLNACPAFHVTSHFVHSLPYKTVMQFGECTV